MRKTSIIMGLALALSVGAAGAASAQSARPERQRSARQDSTSHRGRGHGGEKFLLRGITLSAQQKTQIASLKESQRKQFGELRKQNKDSRSASGRQRGDTTGFGARRAEMQQHREQYAGSMRSILTNDQRAQFDKNVTEMKAKVEQRKHSRS
ncbi:MAG: Spy/CpxP family protein refolding chaperone [bacterium]